MLEIICDVKDVFSNLLNNFNQIFLSNQNYNINIVEKRQTFQKKKKEKHDMYLYMFMDFLIKTKTNFLQKCLEQTY